MTAACSECGAPLREPFCCAHGLPACDPCIDRLYRAWKPFSGLPPDAFRADNDDPTFYAAIAAFTFDPATRPESPPS